MSTVLEYDFKNIINALTKNSNIHNLMGVSSAYKYVIIETNSQYGLVDRNNHKCWFASNLANIIDNMNVSYMPEKNSDLEYNFVRNETTFIITTEYIEDTFDGSLGNPFYSSCYEWIIHGLSPVHQTALQKLFTQKYNKYQSSDTNSSTALSMVSPVVEYSNDAGDDAGDDAGNDAGNDAGDGAGDDTGNDAGDDTGNGAGDDSDNDADDAGSGESEENEDS